MSVDFPAPLSPRMQVTSPALTRAEMSFRATTLPKYLRDVVDLEQVRVACRGGGALGGAHLDLDRSARPRMSVLSMTARKRITPWKVKVQFESHWAPMIPIETIPSIAAPNAVPITDP